MSAEVEYAARAMICPHCNASDSSVIDSRPAEQGTATRRRRECAVCGDRFTTYERLEAPLLIRKRDGTLQLFTVDKVRKGLVRALADGAVTADQMNAAVADIETSVRAMGSELTSDDVGQLVLAFLRQVDEAAYLRFASVHKDFRDAADFEREAATLDRAPEPTG